MKQTASEKQPKITSQLSSKASAFTSYFSSKSKQPTYQILPYTWGEFQTILHNKEISVDHLDKERLTKSFILGLPDDKHSMDRNNDPNGKEENKDGEKPRDGVRGQIWKLCCKVNETREVHNEDMFQRLLEEQIKDEDTIIKDLARTVSGNENFKLDHKTGKNKLYNLLKAYAVYDH